MIYNYPFSPSSTYLRHAHQRNYYPYRVDSNTKHSFSKNSNSNSKESMIDSDYKNTASDSRKSVENEVFEIFGIKLFFDDILLICLIFFLYNEGVKDQALFIILILLLLT